MVDRKVLEDALGHPFSVFPFYPELGMLERGKVRDNYVKDGQRILIATDRVSAFDVVMQEPIPYKGQVLTEIAMHWFSATADIVPNHIIFHPDPVRVGSQRMHAIPA